MSTIQQKLNSYSIPSRIKSFLDKENKIPTSDIEFVTLCEYFFYLSAERNGLSDFRARDYINSESNPEDYLIKLDQILNAYDTNIKQLKEVFTSSLALYEKQYNAQKQEKDQQEEKQEEIKENEEEKNKTIVNSNNDSSDETKVFIPRVFRLNKKLDLTEKEFYALCFTLVCQSGIMISETYTCSGLEIAKLTGMNAKEILEFISPQRLHISQQLIAVDASYRDTITSSTIKMQNECVYTLVGGKLTQEEFLKIDKTVLSELLMEEPGFYLKEKSDNDDVDPFGIDEEKKKKDEDDDEFDLYKFMKNDKPSKTEDDKDDDEEVDEDDELIVPYKSDMDYLEDQFQYLSTKIRIKNIEIEKKSEEVEINRYGSRDTNYDGILRELKGKCRMYQGKCERRLKLTLSENQFIPRLERLAKFRKLDEFEKNVLIICVGMVISHDLSLAVNARRGSNLNVGYLLLIFCDTLQERINHRRYFYKKSSLIKDGMIRLSDRYSSDLMDSDVDIDRRMLDYLCGLDSEFSEVVEGSHLFYPNVKLDNVVLPKAQKDLIVDTVVNFEKFKTIKKQLGFDEIITYGNSIVLLFYGPSGTGKTMCAQALANVLGKKMLLINFANVNDKEAVLKFIFREAKINDALLFFDECESFFEDRGYYRSDTAALLTEIEKFDGLIVMATNRQYDLDEAMHRRISCVFEFSNPDPILRKAIWEKHIPEKVKLAPDVDLESLSLEFELSGGLIKNAVLSALSYAISRDSENPIITQDDLYRGSKAQLRGVLKMRDFDRKVIPKRGLQDLVVHDKLAQKLKELIAFEKSRKILFGQWGFDKFETSKQGTTVLMYGPSGSGKSLSAEVIGFEIGQPLKVVDVNELLAKYTYDTSRNIETLFKETKEMGAVLVLEMSDVLGETRSASLSVLLHHIEHYAGIVILIAGSETNTIENSLMRRFKFVLKYSLPTVNERKTMWRNLIPDKVPNELEEKDYDYLAVEYEGFSGGNIQNCIFRACSRASLSIERKLTMKLMKESCEEEIKNCGNAMSEEKKTSIYQ
ncbi:hypothetical protein ABK040_010374 [Willaertia magna]